MEGSFKILCLKGACYEYRYGQREIKRMPTSDTYSGVCGDLVCERNDIINAWETVAFY